MNYRERFLRTMNFQTPDRVPNHELGIWGQTHERWLSEGLPEDALRGDFFRGEDFFKLDKREFVNIAVDMMPHFEHQVIEEDERVIIYRDGNGIKRKALKEGTVRGTRPSMDQYIDFPVKNIADFQEMKKRYDSKSPERYPQDWDERVKDWKARDCPLCLLTNAAFGFYSTPRKWMGTENLSLAFYDQPKLVHEMMDFLADFIIDVTKRAVEELDIDYFNFFEDMACKSGPLISPQMFKEFMLPRYKRVIDFFNRHGIKTILVDSDGNTEHLLPLFIEAGVTCHWPLEVAADMDALKLRKEYERDLALSGGVDKRELAKDKKAIEKEVERISPLIEGGGYIPTVDHTVPPDVSYDNFMYYMEIKMKALRGEYGA
ncbi:TPA: hypothetical protein EYP66_22610 [Candidatus Poribacteria bacterium]|nr:hypothetical protein [Candidatus Poribacteria bacterium]